MHVCILSYTENIILGLPLVWFDEKKKKEKRWVFSLSKYVNTGIKITRNQHTFIIFNLCLHTFLFYSHTISHFMAITENNSILVTIKQSKIQLRTKKQIFIQYAFLVPRSKLSNFVLLYENKLKKKGGKLHDEYFM